MVVGNSALAGVVHGARFGRPPIDGFDRGRGQRPETHCGNVDDRCGAEGTAPLPMAAEYLGRRHIVTPTAVGLGGRRDVGEGAVLDDWIALGELGVVVGAKAEVVVLEFRRRVDPAPLVPAEGSFLIIAADDVLAQFRPNRLECVPRVPDDGEVPQNGVPLLQEVVGGQAGHADNRDYR